MSPATCFFNLSFRAKNAIISLKAFFFIFSTTIPFIRKINSIARLITLEDIPEPQYNSTPTYFRDKILLEYTKNQQQKHPKELSFFRIFIRVYWKPFWGAILAQFIFAASRLFYGLLLRQLLVAIGDKDEENNELLMKSFFLITCIIIGTIFRYYRGLKSEEFNLILKQCLISLIYYRCIHLSQSSLQTLNPGRIINIVANDINQLDVGLSQFISLLCAPFVLLGTIIMLWSFFGLACIPGIALLFLSVPIQLFLTNRSKMWRREKNSTTDKRIKLISELLEGIRQVKLYAWEIKFMDSVKNIRQEEIRLLRKMLTLDAGNRAFAMSSTAISSFAILLFYYLANGELHADTIYPTFFVLNFARIWGIIFAIAGYTSFIEIKLLYERVLKVLNAKNMNHEALAPLDEKNCIEIKDLSVQWIGSRKFLELGLKKVHPLIETPILNKITLNIESKSHIGIIGKTGAGKTSLLLSLLNELEIIRGTIRTRGRFAYVEQEPIFFEGTIRENILFGLEFDREFYDKVTKACCLHDDFGCLAHADLTELSEKGANLSGGQRARLSLARAVYSRADIYLLDDPISAVDHKVANLLIENVVEGLLKDKTVLMATHHIQHLENFDKVMILSSGELVSYDSYVYSKAKSIEVLEEKQKPTPRSSSKKNTINNRTSLQQLKSYNPDDLAVITDRALQIPSALSNDTEVDEMIEKAEPNLETETIPATPYDHASNDLKHKIQARPSKLSFKTYKDYLKVMFSPCQILIFFLFVAPLTEIANTVYFRMVGIWAEGSVDPVLAAVVCGVLIISVLASQLIRHLSWFRGTVRAAQKLHDKILLRIVRSPFAFFDKTPSGDILNRFASDMGILDRLLCVSTYESIEGLYLLSGILVTVCVIKPVVAIPGLVSCLFYIWIFKFISKAMSICKSFELETRGGIYTNFISTLNGSVPIRVYGQTHNFIENFMEKVKENFKCSYHYWYCVRFQSMFIDIGGTIFVIVSILIIILTRDKNTDPSIYGLALSYLLTLNNDFGFLFKQMVQMNILMENTARVLEYTHLESEAEIVKERDSIIKAEKWPLSGNIKFRDVYLKYRDDLDHVVKGLDFEIKPGEKVAVVGRTGAGKSSLVQALFRSYELDSRQTRTTAIEIDDVNIHSIGLHTLRGSLSIIPQTPVLFTGSIRENLDPLGDYEDEEMWKALNEVDLGCIVAELDLKLNTKISNTTSIFSVGQKQLFCLARAILKKSKVLVLDEATAFVDTNTDAFIQEKVSKIFDKSTVITIAHRLTTIAHYDKIVVLEQGKILEYGHPYELLVEKIGDRELNCEKEVGFARMVLNSGLTNSQSILNISSENYFSRNFD